LDADIARSFTEQELVDYAIPYSPRFAPGAQYQYSNTNTVLLGMFVRMVTSDCHASALQRLILGPLGLTHTAYPDFIPCRRRIPRLFGRITSGEIEALPLLSPTGLAGAGAMTSTLDDLRMGRRARDGRLIGNALQRIRIERSRA
jgi:D-alanyl-D-alanine carboxypeptidase